MHNTHIRYSIIAVSIFVCALCYFGIINYIQYKAESNTPLPQQTLTREDSVSLAETFVKDVGLIPVEHTIWVSDIIGTQDLDAVDYFARLQLEHADVGIFPWKRIISFEPFNEKLHNGSLWRWSVRVTDDVDHRGGYVIDMASDTGEILGFSRFGFDTQKNTTQTTEEERWQIAQSFLQHTVYVDNISNFTLQASDGAQDTYCSTWEHTESKENILPIHTTIEVCGKRVEEYASHLLPPEEVGFGTMWKNIVFGIIPFVLLGIKTLLVIVGIPIYLYIRKIKNNPLPLVWRQSVVFMLTLFAFFWASNICTKVGVMWYNHMIQSVPVTIWSALSIIRSTLEETIFGGVFFLVVPSVLLLTVGRHLALTYFPQSLRAFDLFFSGKWASRELFVATIRGVHIWLVLVCLECIFIFVFGHFFHSWTDVRIPLNSIGTYFHLYSLDVHNFLNGAFYEEILIRLFLVSFLYMRYRNALIAILGSACVWALLHVTAVYHPFYGQIINLTLDGVVLGWVFVRYGLWEGIVAHFLFNITVFSVSIGATTTLAVGLLFVCFVSLPVTILLCIYPIRAYITHKRIPNEMLR